MYICIYKIWEESPPQTAHLFARTLSIQMASGTTWNLDMHKY